MVSDMLNSVLKKEEETARNEQKSRAEAEDIIKNAEAQAKDILENAASQAAENSRAEIEKARCNADKLYIDAQSEAEKTIEGLKAASLTRIDEAAKAVKEIILK